jgi:ribonuclease HI
MSSELWGIFEGLMFAWEEGIRKVLVQSDSRVAVESLKRAPDAFDPNRELINCCINLIKRKWDCKVEYIDREANLAAKAVAANFENLSLEVTLYK